MPTTIETKVTVFNQNTEIVGWARNFGCENDSCISAICNGKRWHAIPVGFAVTLPDYHFRDLDEAIFALHGAMVQS